MDGPFLSAGSSAAAATTASRGRSAFLGRDTRRTGAIFTIAALLILASVELAIGLRALGVGPRLLEAPSLDYTGMPHPLSPLGARFIESVLGAGAADPAGGGLARGEGSVDVGGEASAAGTGFSQLSERVIDTHPLTNDDRKNARVIPSIPFTARTNDSGASRDDSDPAQCSSVGSTVWYRFKPEANVGLVAFTYGTDHSVALGVFNQSAGELRKIGCDTDPRGNALFAFPAKAGRTYLFQLTAPAESGELVLHLEAHGDFELISVARDGGAANASSGWAHALSANGRYAAFSSRATNLVEGVDDRPCWTTNPMYAYYDDRPCSQIYVRDLRTSRTDIISVTRRGGQGDGESASPFLSADGRYVAFESAALNLSDRHHPIFPDVFVHDRRTNRTEWIAPGTRNGGSAHPSLSDDGRYVAFASSEGLVTEDTNGDYDVYVFDRKTDHFELVTASPDGRPSEYSDPRSRKLAPCLGPITVIDPLVPSPGLVLPDFNPYISGDGRWVVFRSDAINLVPNDDNGEWDAFVRDRATGRTERVSVSSSGAEGNGSTYHNALANPQISANGRYVVFASCASNIAPADDDDFLDAFRHDRWTGRTTLLSGVLRGDVTGFPTISRDGRFVTFDSQPIEVPNETAASDVYLHDTLTGATSFVTLTPFGTDSSGWTGTISADGTAVLFLSNNRNLGRTEGLDNTFLYRLPKNL